MTSKLNTPKTQFALLGAAAVAVGVINAADTTVPQGALSGLLLFALAAFLYWGRERFDSINVLSGHGDERTRSLFTQASADTGTILAVVITGWWFAGGIAGEVNSTLTILAAVGAASFLTSAWTSSRRG